MPRVLTRAQVEHYHAFGYVSPVEVMPGNEALRYRAMLEEAERTHPGAIHAENRNNAHLVFKFLDALVHHPVIVGAVEDLIGVDISLWGSVLFVKEPRSAGYVSWHQDATYMGMSNNAFVTPWLALTPSNRHNGCMTMIPASHTRHIRPHQDTFDQDNILTRGQAVPGIDESAGIDLVLEPGQMSLHHAQVIHGSQPNYSNDRRIGFAMQSYMPPSVRQAVGKDIWLPIQGNNHRPGSITLTRPSADMSPEAVAQRELVNQNNADVLYHGAKERRGY